MEPTGASREQERVAFAADRLGLWMGVTAALAVGRWALALVIVAAERSLGTATPSMDALDVAELPSAIFVGGLGWLASRAKTQRAVERWDLGLCLVCGGLSVLPALEEFDARTSALRLTLHLTYVLFVRAALVPTRPLQTGLQGVWTWVLALTLTLATFPIRFPTAEAVELTVLTLILGLWGGFTVLITVVLTQSLYGLRKQVADHGTLGQYVIEEKIAEGGMGVVYKARHALLRRPAALKLLRPELSNEVSVARFEKEVRLTSMLTHPNTVAIYDYGITEEGVFYYVMELLEGTDLQALVAHVGPLPQARAIHLLRPAVDALSEAHGDGLIHRDVKPSNLFVSRAGPLRDWVKVLDFGLVRGGAASIELSMDEAVIGTPSCMAPEQISSPRTIDARADLYALGCVLFYALTGRHVFLGTPLEVMARHVKDPAPSLSEHRPDADPEIVALVGQLLEKDREKRPANARQVLDTLDRLAERMPWTREMAGQAWVDVPAAPPGSAPEEGTRLTVRLRSSPKLDAG